MADQPKIPLDIMSVILTNVEPKNLVRCSCLNKEFSALISSDEFCKRHLRQSFESSSYMYQTEYSYFVSDETSKAVHIDQGSLVLKNIQFVNCCKGLACFSHGYEMNTESKISIWNPLTSQYKILPAPQIKVDDNLHAISKGFAFIPALGDYMVVRMVNFHDDFYRSHIEIEIYSLSNDSWRVVGQFPYTQILMIDSRAVLNDTIHWFAAPGLSPLPEGEVNEAEGEVNEDDLLDNVVIVQKIKCYECIIAFDLINETLREIQVPDIDLDVDIVEGVLLRVFKGCLYMLVCRGRDIEVWKIRDYGVTDTWSYLCRINCEFTTIPLDFLRNGDILLKQFTTNAGLHRYCLETGERTPFLLRGLEGKDVIDAIPYNESLALTLKSGTNNTERAKFEDSHTSGHGVTRAGGGNVPEPISGPGLLL